MISLYCRVSAPLWRYPLTSKECVAHIVSKPLNKFVTRLADKPPRIFYLTNILIFLTPLLPTFLKAVPTPNNQPDLLLLRHYWCTHCFLWPYWGWAVFGGYLWLQFKPMFPLCPSPILLIPVMNDAIKISATIHHRWVLPVLHYPS